jgi:hypothetical protein
VGDHGRRANDRANDRVNDRNCSSGPIVFIAKSFALSISNLAGSALGINNIVGRVESDGKKMGGVGVVVTGKDGLLTGHAQWFPQHPVPQIKLRGTIGGRHTLADTELPHMVMGSVRGF